ncbi:MAG: hypothetical protein KIT84_36035 [Labilithrix sp.]|nr:hypothetical protein [Labilithrix sp.]MCW5816464.1 hypothetical protein [Labilithrix sp.]
MPKERRFPAITKAIRTASEQLAKMPPSTEVETLRSDVRSIEAEVDGWTVTPPEAPQREGMMQRILAIHLTITRLVRRT